MSVLEYSSVSASGAKLQLNPELYNFNSLHTCRKCRKYHTKSLFSIRNHVRKHLEQNVLFHCEEFSLEPFLCKECEFFTYFTIEFKKHIISHLSMTEKKLDSKYWLKGMYSVRVCHQKNMKGLECKTENNSELFKCKLCTYQCKTKGTLQQHNIWKHASPDEIQWFHCRKCKFKSKTKGGLESHVLRKHSKTKIDKHVEWFKCKSCTFKCTIKGNLQQHIIWKHASPDEIRWFYCGKCPFKSKTKDGLQKHIFRLHSTTKQER